MEKTNFVLDTSVVIEILLDTPKGRRIHAHVSKGNMFVSQITVIELVSTTMRRKNDPEASFRAMVKECTIVEMNGELEYDTGMYHAVIRKRVPKFSYGDAAVVAAANMLKATIVTCDTDFRHIKNAIVVQ